MVDNASPTTCILYLLGFYCNTKLYGLMLKTHRFRHLAKVVTQQCMPSTRRVIW